MEKYRSLENVIRAVVKESATGYSHMKGNVTGTDIGSPIQQGPGRPIGRLQHLSNIRVQNKDDAARNASQNAKKQREDTIADRKHAEKIRKHTGKVYAEEEKETDSVPEGTEKRRKVENVARENSAEPTSEKSTLGRNASIVSKVLEEKQAVFSDNKFGLPTSVIETTRAILEKTMESHPGDPKKITAGGKTDVKIEPSLKQLTANEEVKKDNKDIDGEESGSEEEEKEKSKVNKEKNEQKKMAEDVNFSDDELETLEELAASLGLNEAPYGSSDGKQSYNTNDQGGSRGLGPTTSGYLQEKCKKCKKKMCTCGMKEELSPKQKKIAALAGNPKKIDAEDFKELRAHGMKESNEKSLEVHNTQEHPGRAKEIEKIIKGATKKIFGEESVLDEGRGRPRKNPIEKPEDDDTEANSNVINRIRQARNSMAGGAKTTLKHENGEETVLTPDVARMLDNAHNVKRTPAEKEAFVSAIRASRASMLKAMGH